MLKLFRKASQSLSGDQDCYKAGSAKALRPAVLLPGEEGTTEKQAYAEKDAAGTPWGTVHANGSCAPDAGQKEPLVHLSLVLDVSASMRGDPLRSLARGIRQMLKHLQPWESLTIWM